MNLYINQLGYSLHQGSHSPELSGVRLQSELPLAFERLQCLWRSVEIIKSWLDYFYKIPCSDLVGQPFHFWSQMILTVTLLKYLSVLDDPDWDYQAVRNTVHLISTVDCMLEKLDLSSKEPQLRCDDHLMKYLSKLLSRSRMWTEARWNAARQRSDMEVGSAASSRVDVAGQELDPSPVPGFDQMAWIQSMDLGDERWFEDILGMPATL